MRKEVLINKYAQIALFSKGGYIGVIWCYRKEVGSSRVCKSSTPYKFGGGVR